MSVTTKVEERLSLSFDGKFLLFRVLEKGQILQFSYKSVSGIPINVSPLIRLIEVTAVVKYVKKAFQRPEKELRVFDYSHERQKKRNKGPIPEGKYHIDPQEIQYTAGRSIWDRFKGEFKRGNFPGGKISWGVGRVWIEPREVIIAGVLRNNFSIHGGSFGGSIGCIDLMGNDLHFFETLEKYRGQSNRISLIVKY